MSNIIPFNQAQSPLPAHLADVFGGHANIASRASVDQLSVKGKVWRRIVDGEETQLTRRNPETGDTEPVSIVSLIVLDQNRTRSRAFHPNGFTEGKNEAPACYSADGIAPDPQVKEPCATSCATCPNSVKGSKVTEAGKAVTACVAYKRIAVVPTQAVTSHPIMLLKLAQTSIWDKDNGENEAQGWYAWDQYCDMLRARGAKHTAAVETKVKFDLRVAYPKLLFSAARWLNADEAVAAKGRLDGEADKIKTILTGAAEHDGLTGTPSPEYLANQAKSVAAPPAVEPDKAVKGVASKPAKAPDAAAAAEEAEDDSEGDSEAEDTGFSTPTAKRVAAKNEPAAVKATPVEAAPAVSGTPAGLADLLDGWDA